MIDMYGLYKFYRGNELIYEQKNSLTTVGRSLILKSVMGLVPSIGGVIITGTGTTTDTPNSDGLITRTSLEFPVAQAPVTLSSLNATGATDALVFSATINDINKLSISEVGLYPLSPNDVESGPDSILLYSGSAADGWKDLSGNDVTTDSTDSKIITSGSFKVGSEALSVKAGNYEVYSNIINKDFSQYGTEDIFKVAVVSAGTTGTITLTLTFTTNDEGTAYYEKVFTLANSGQYQVLSCKKSDFTANGNADWTTVSKTTLAAATSNIVVDGIRIEPASNIDPNYGLISRAVLPSALIKNADEPITIEYYLALAFNTGV